MEYFLIIILQIIGIGLHVMQKISGLGATNPDKTRNEIVAIFFNEDWDTLCISGLVMSLNIVGHFILVHYTDFHKTVDNLQLYGFALALVLGYAGQRIIYKYLGSAEKFLDKKVGDKLQ